MNSEWRKSTKSAAAGHCVEVMRTEDTVSVRNSKTPDVAPLVYTLDEWDAFVQGVHNGEFEI
jgi:hypothetical protein